ncbi:MAG: arginine deiminase family protein [Hyphomicrobiaceae bacterium]
MVKPLDPNVAAMTEADFRYNMMIKRFASEPQPPFESAGQQEAVWGRRWGCNNDVGRLRMVLMHRPGSELDVIDRSRRIEDLGGYGDDASGWYWIGRDIPPAEVYRAQHQALVMALEEEGVEVVLVGEAAAGRMKSIYTRDSVIAVDGGAIVTRMGPRIRRGEELPVTRALARIGMPILRTIHGAGIVEGGSFAFLRPDVAVIGLSSRVNEEGARQLEEVLKVQGVELIRVEIPGYRLHIDGMFVMIDVDTALINPARLPFVFIERLASLGIRTIELTPEDPAWAINCLAVRPGRILVSDKLSPRTSERLEKAGISVRHVPYSDVCLGGGGIHCSTAPLVRDPL